MRKKRRQPQKREPFPGAGYWLDFENIKTDDFEIVEKRLDEISLREEQIRHLLTLKQYFDYKAGDKAEEIAGLGAALPPEMRELLANMRVFGDQLNRKLEHLRNLEEIEKGTTATASTEAGRLTIAQCVWALHYLLIESGLSYAGVDKSVVARFISAITGYGFDNVYKRVKEKHGKNEKATQQDLATVREWFGEMGLEAIAKKIEGERNLG
ncbi:MAG TPA: hypothetical protein VFV58_13300 [Blastocatellia bacterium]|jgi:hypothetical protein|nr:hypothetical protein [Blastocatellia bacterium]